MQKRPDNQKEFFDMVVYERLIPKEHILTKIATEIDFSFIDEETKLIFSKRKTFLFCFFIIQDAIFRISI